MKKLIFALSALLLIVSACGEKKTKTFTYGDLTFTYPAEYELDSTTQDDGTLVVYLQHKDILSNSLNMEVYALDMDQVNAASEEELLNYLKGYCQDYYDIWVGDDDDFVIEAQSELDTNNSPLMAYITMRGKAYDEPFDGEIICMIWDEYCLTGFVSGVDEKASDEVLDIMLSCM